MGQAEGSGRVSRGCDIQGGPKRKGSGQWEDFSQKGDELTLAAASSSPLQGCGAQWLKKPCHVPPLLTTPGPSVVPHLTQTAHSLSTLTSHPFGRTATCPSCTAPSAHFAALYLNVCTLSFYLDFAFSILFFRAQPGSCFS